MQSEASELLISLDVQSLDGPRICFILQTESSAVIAALESPLEGPVGGCHYRISVSSHALSGEYIPPGSIILVDVESEYTE